MTAGLYHSAADSATENVEGNMKKRIWVVVLTALFVASTMAAGRASAAKNHKRAWCHSDGLNDAFEVVYGKKHRNHGDQPAERLRDEDGRRYFSCAYLQN